MKRSLILLLPAAGLLALLISGGAAQEDSDPPSAQKLADLTPPALPADDSGSLAKRQSKAIRLKHARADVVADLLSQLYGAKETAVNDRGRGPSGKEMISKHYQGENLAIVAETASNSLLVSAPAERLAEIDALVQRLEQPPSESRLPSIKSSAGRQGRRKGGSTRPKSPAIENLRAEYERLDREAAQAAAQYRKTRGADDRPRSAEQRDEQRSDLRDRVAAAFAARQALQRTELEQLRAQFARIERQIESRARLQDEIIDRRLEELMNPNLQWARGESPTAAPTSVVEAPLSSSQAQALQRIQNLEAVADAESSPPRKAELYRQAAAAYEEMYRKHRSQVLSLYARLYQARCLEKLGEESQAKAIYSQLGWTPDEARAKPSSSESGDVAPATPVADRARPSVARTGSDLAVLEAKLAAAEERLSGLRSVLEHERRPQIAREVNEAQAAVDVARAELEQARREYGTKEQLLRLDLEAAKLRVDAARALLAEAESIRQQKPDAVSENVIAERRFSVRQAELEVQRAETLLEAHRQQSGTERSQLERPDDAAHVKEADLAKLVWDVLGMELEPVDRQAVETAPFRGGMAILKILTNGPAHKAGLRAGDILVGLHVWETISNDNLAFILQQELLREGGAASGIKTLVLRDGDAFTTILWPDRRRVSSGRSR